jgi:hypothetical protein
VKGETDGPETNRYSEDNTDPNTKAMAEEEIKVSGGISLQLVPILEEKENWIP